MERGTGVRLGMGRRAPDVELGGGCWTWSRRRVLDMDGDLGGHGAGRQRRTWNEVVGAGHGARRCAGHGAGRGDRG